MKMNKLNITKFEFIGIIAASVLLFFVIVPRAFAVSESRYHRSDTHTINGLNAYQLGTSQSATGLTDFKYSSSDVGCPYFVKWFADVVKRDAAGTETVLGSKIAEFTRNSATNGYYSATWAAPQTALSSTDAINVVEKLDSPDISIPVATRTWITPQLNATQLDAATWTFWRYCSYNCQYLQSNYVRPVQWGLFHGSSDYNTRIENFSYTPVSYVDCGLRIRTGTLTLTIACEPAGTLTSALRIRKGATTYGIVLVATTDANASPIRIYTSSGVKALRKY